MTRTRETQFNPARFTDAPSSRDMFVPPSRLMRTMTITETVFGGWPVFSVAARPGGTASVLYLHGGAWAAEIRPGHWAFIAKLAELTERTIVVPIYPLVPSITHAELNPILTELWATVSQTGPTTLMGDSAGATMALNLLRSLPADFVRPEKSVLLSPALDITLSNPDIAIVAPHDPLLRADHLRTLASMYAGADGADDPSINPMRSRLDRLGEVHLFTGTRDIFNPDARVFTAKAASASDTTVVLHEAAAMLHDWMLMPTPEAAATLQEVASLLRL